MLAGLATGCSDDASGSSADTPVVTPPPQVPAKWKKFAHYRPYRVANSVKGLDRARAEGYPAIDLDFQISADGVLVNAHWPKLRKEGFAQLRGHDPETRFDELTWDQISRLRRPDGSRVETATTMIAEATRRGLRVELEPKGTPGLTRAGPWKRLAKQLEGTESDVQVKVLTVFATARAILTAAHDAGFTTIVLPRGQRKVPRAWWPAIDYVRGPVHWT